MTEQPPIIGTEKGNSATALALAGLGLLVVLSDPLFENEGGALSFLIYGAAILAVSAFVNKDRLTSPISIAVLYFLALAPMAVDLSGLSFIVSFTLVAITSFRIWGRKFDTTLQWVRGLALFALTLPLRFVPDIARWYGELKAAERSSVRLSGLAIWLMPAVAGAVFLLLFAEANPVLDRLLSLIEIWKLIEWIRFDRLFFWMFTAAVTWPFLNPRQILQKAVRKLPAVETQPETASRGGVHGVIFGDGAILRSLALFNMLFAVQTGLDIFYLWGGATLPEGMSYAAYAHRGAYPLIVTALLAALFVLVALRPGSTAAENSLIRYLVYAWILQNVGLVLSSILRLELYTNVYALTYMRVAAFIWMGVVACGLILITVRIAAGHGGAWLVNRNLALAGLVLYASCFINFGAIIARYNVDHSLEMGGEGTGLDMYYLYTLGPAAIPAFDRFLAEASDISDMQRKDGEDSRDRLVNRHQAQMENWRNWSLRNWLIEIDGRHLGESRQLEHGGRYDKRSERLPTPADN
ncbi:MAG: DUF4173 domain-containing protein [Rhizobiaceae bacterium]